RAPRQTVRARCGAPPSAGSCGRGTRRGPARAPARRQPLRSRRVPPPDSPSASPPSESSTGHPSPYDRIAALYDPWSRSVVEDVSFYVAEARKARGTVVELGVGTGRIAVPTAEAGVRVIGVDSSAGMLEVCRARAAEAGVADRLDLRLGDLRDPPVTERVPLVTCPFRSYLHLTDDAERLAALRAARDLLVDGGRLVFDVFAPSAEDIAETNGRWLEREPGIWER